MATTRVTGRGPGHPEDEAFREALQRGGELLAAGRVGEARGPLERAHALDPRSDKGQNLLGLCYFKLGLFDGAAELYERLVRDNPTDPTLRVNLGLVYLKTSALQRAVREFEVACDLAPEHKKAHNYLGLALAQAGEYGRAREHFLLAGSEPMAERMARAIAGEPATAGPARARPPGPPPSPLEQALGASGEPPGGPAAPPPLQEEEVELRFAEDEGPAPEPPLAEAAAPAPDALATAPAQDALAAYAPQVPLLEELVPQLALGAGLGPFVVGPGSATLAVEGALYSRLTDLVGYRGALGFEPQPRRAGGAPTREPFGAGDGQVHRVEGQGALVVETGERTYLPLALGPAPATFREPCVFAFEAGVAYENASVPGEGGVGDVGLVRLAGPGRALLAFDGVLQSLQVSAGAPVTVPVSHLVGWTGALAPRASSLAAGGGVPRAAVALQGEGFALIALSMR